MATIMVVQSNEKNQEMVLREETLDLTLRTPQQNETIIAISKRPEFAGLALNNTRDSDTPTDGYKCTFLCLWYDKQKQFHATRITPTGNITNEY